jgi:RNA polymerase primary sigma factor
MVGNTKTKSNESYDGEGVDAAAIDNVTFEGELDQGLLSEGSEMESAEMEGLHSDERRESDDDLADLFLSNDPVRDYLRQIGQVSLLSQTQERDLAQRVEIGLYARKKLAEDNGELDIITRNNLEWLIEDGKRSRDHLVDANLRLVVSLAKRYAGHSLKFQDLIQEGNLGLVRAVEKYDYAKSFRFSTYATWWIRQSITRAIADQGRTIRIPVHMVEVINRLNKVTKRLAVEKGRTPTTKELSEELGISVKKVREAQKYGREPKSIHTPIGDDGETEFGDIIEDSNALDQFDVVSANFMRAQLFKLIDTFTDKEREVITLRYGLYDQVNHTLDEIGRKLEVTRERVRQIEQKTMTKLRHPSRAQLLKDFYEK